MADVEIMSAEMIAMVIMIIVEIVNMFAVMMVEKAKLVMTLVARVTLTETVLRQI